MRIEEIETYFASIELPQSIHLKAGETIVDVPKFVDSHLKTLKCNSGNRRFLPHYNRLMGLIAVLNEKPSD